ncbi:hypothetical protein [Roseibium aggregatum]|uniref:Uncharacterized protein n=1 Tax=Roseibium aggregatum TaxID=187304 RepID=A0A0M6YC23_9HYPH|nr:hypothetical protein [Roseibium aggregatum]CTQ46817.1 hypothetical protein LAL4801_05277 [Roseibium aggregatum]
MEDSNTPGLRPGTEARSEPFPDVIEQIHRELQRLDMPCTCKEQLDRTIVAIETWRTLKLQRDLTGNIEAEYAQMASGISFLSDLALLSRKPLTAQEMLDHAESLKFLADMADRCARRLTELARISGKT